MGIPEFFGNVFPTLTLQCLLEESSDAFRMWSQLHMRENHEHEKIKKWKYWKMVRFTKSVLLNWWEPKTSWASWQSYSVSLSHWLCVSVIYSVTQRCLTQRCVLAQLYQISIIRETLQNNFAATVLQKQSKHCPQKQLVKCYVILETLWELLATPMTCCQFRHSCDRGWVLHAAFGLERCKDTAKVPRVFMKGAAYKLGSAVVPSENVYWASRNQFLNFIMLGIAWRCIL